MNIPQTIIRFPEIQLRPRDAHKLRGYFGNLFKEKSELLHNHMGNGEYRYAYPQVQYKVVGNTPHLVGINEGARLLTELFLKIQELEIDSKKYPVRQKNIEGKNVEVGVVTEPITYRFETLWMGVNQRNYQRFVCANLLEKRELLEHILVGNCLSFLKSVDLFVEEQIMVSGTFKEKSTHFKNKRMLAFEGMFSVNLNLPDYIGLGKSVSRGFGTIKRV